MSYLPKHSSGSEHVASDDEMCLEFHRASKSGDLLRVRGMVESGADVNVRNRNGWTPLMSAAGEGHVLIIEYLLSKGANVAEVNKVGASALAYAALVGQAAIEVLLKAGAPVDVRPHGVSLLEFAEWGEGRFRTRRHFGILEAAGAA